MTAAAEKPRLPVSLDANPKLASWISISPEGHVVLSPGKVEIGQGIVTALAQIAADELDVDIARIRMVRATTAGSPDEGVTSGSLSVQQSGRAVRHVCSEVRGIFLEAAAKRLGVGRDALDVSDGVIFGPRNMRVSYWELAGDVSLDRAATPGVAAKSSSRRTVAGQPVARLDIPDKVFAQPRFIHDWKLPGMLHGRVLRPAVCAARLDRLVEEDAHGVDGVVAVVRDGNFAGVVGETENAAQDALKALRKRAVWSASEPLPDQNRLAEWLKAQPVESTVVDSKVSAAANSVRRNVRRQYSRPFIAHGSIAPSCAIALWDGDRVHVWTHSQGVYLLRTDLAKTLGLPADHIVVEHMEGAGCYGHNGADDVALDAVLLARATPGRPVRLQWSREDEMTHAPFGAAMAIEIEAGLDEAGEIVHWRHEIWGNGHTARPGRAAVPALLAASELAKPFPRTIASNPPIATGGGAQRNSIPLYDLPAWQINCHRLLVSPVRTSALRTLGGHGNVFAIESFLDELAAERGEDPVAFRLRHLSDRRGRDVIQAAARRANWKPPAKAGVGHGIGFARYKNTGAYCAVVAEVEGDAEIRVRRLCVAVDVGEAINPDGIVNQIEGGAIQAVSWALKEEVRFDRNGITSNDWSSYPILRFSEVPEVVVEIVSRPEMDPLGAGEAAHGPVAAAIANAAFDALGARVRDLPITRERLIAAMEATP
jgi:CO/xanthine dehydrogenase Mo-binding subunit